MGQWIVISWHCIMRYIKFCHLRETCLLLCKNWNCWKWYQEQGYPIWGWTIGPLSPHGGLFLISQNCLGTSRDFSSLHIVLLQNDTDFSYILLNKGQNSYSNPLVYTFFAYLRHLQILSGITCPNEHLTSPCVPTPHAKICMDNPDAWGLDTRIQDTGHWDRLAIDFRYVLPA